MIRVYTAPGSQSCRKVIAWLKEHNLSFIEKNIFSSDLHANELREILERCENGTDDILSKNKGVIASFSRALTEGLSAQQTDDEFNKTLATTIEGIYEASVK